MAARRPPAFTIDPRARTTIERWIRAKSTPPRTALRGRIVLMLGEGLSGREVARRLGIARHTVDLWRKRYLDEGPESLPRDKPGRGRRARTRSDPTVTIEQTATPTVSSVSE